MNNETEFFAKIQNVDQTSTYRVKTEWGKDSFQLFVIEGEAAWFALVAKDYIQKLADQHELEHTAYFKNVQNYLTTDTADSISFNVVNNQFIIYHNIEKEKLKVKYFFIKLEKADYRQSAEMFIDSLTAKRTQLLKHLETARVKCLEAESLRTLYEEKCDRFTETKRKSDLQMYSAFTLLLNEKKCRIRFLSELLDSDYGEKIKNNNLAKRQTKTDAPLSQAGPSTSRAQEAISDSDPESNDGYNTEEEKRSSTAVLSKRTLDLLMEDDSPSFPVLPKRVKTNGNVVTISTEKDVYAEPPNVQIDSKVKEVKETASVPTNQLDLNNDSDEFTSTQDFLDKL